MTTGLWEWLQTTMAVILPRSVCWKPVFPLEGTNKSEVIWRCCLRPSSLEGALNGEKKRSVSRSVMSNFLRPHGLQPARLLCLWNSPDKNTGVGSHSFLQGIFPTQWSNAGLPYYRPILYCPSHQGSHWMEKQGSKISASLACALGRPVHL